MHSMITKSRPRFVYENMSELSYETYGLLVNHVPNPFFTYECLFMRQIC